MLGRVVAALRCPVCHRPLVDGGSVVRCPAGHSFDLARQGYLHLAGRLAHHGDSGEMVAARARLLDSGAYDFLSAALVDAVPSGTRGLVIDAGAGTAHHLAAVLAALPEAVGLAVDVSKPAVRRAARAHPRAGAVLADGWRRLPVADGAADVVLNVFAPRNGAEFARVLRPDGALVVATPAADHLAELVARLGLLRVDPDKPARVAASLRPWFRPDREHLHTRELRLTREQVRWLVAMGPSAWHTGPDRLASAVSALPEPVPVTASVRVACYTPTRSGYVDRSISSQPRGGS